MWAYDDGDLVAPPVDSDRVRFARGRVLRWVYAPVVGRSTAESTEIDDHHDDLICPLDHDDEYAYA